jgi:hypothetical protein
VARGGKIDLWTCPSIVNSPICPCICKQMRLISEQMLQPQGPMTIKAKRTHLQAAKGSPSRVIVIYISLQSAVQTTHSEKPNMPLASHQTLPLCPPLLVDYDFCFRYPVIFEGHSSGELFPSG